MGQLTGIRAIVTGASRGIGRAITERLADEGARLALIARGAGTLEDRAKDCALREAEAQIFPCDLTDAAAVEHQFQAAIGWLGGVDLLVNNAGVGHMGSIEELTIPQFDEMIATNLRGAFLCSRAVVPVMKDQGGGTIINIASIAGKAGFLGGGGYCASKFGIMGLSECMGLDLRKHNIRVAAICPGSVNAPDFHRSSARIRAANMIQAADVADAVVYIARQPKRIFIRELEIRVTRPE